jgi:hypothetical protein
VLSSSAPTECDPVVVALPTIVDDAVERKPVDRVISDVVAETPADG